MIGQSSIVQIVGNVGLDATLGNQHGAFFMARPPKKRTPSVCLSLRATASDTKNGSALKGTVVDSEGANHQGRPPAADSGDIESREWRSR